jgi:hypothetical protein
MAKNTFATAMKEEMKWGKTWNGADKLNTTGSGLLDFFGLAGSMRASKVEEKLTLFDEAYAEDPDAAMKLLFYTRDARGGAGERDTVRQILAHLGDVHKDSAVKNFWAILEFGRADDLYAFIGTKAEQDMWAFMKHQFELDLENMEKGNSVSLLAKWIATPDATSPATETLGKQTAKAFGYSFKTMRDYKRKLRALREYIGIVESKMAAGEWDKIEYSKCASRFILKHKTAIMKHDGERYNAYLESVEKGETTMHMDTVTPVDIMHSVNTNYTPDLETMWKSLPDTNTGNALVVLDTSGSMTESDYGLSVTPIEVGSALAIYLAERNKGDFKNLFMTFSESPEFVQIKGATLKQKLAQIEKTNWGWNTNLEKAFDRILQLAIDNDIKSEDMPDALAVISDMQIDAHMSGFEGGRMTFFDRMKTRFEEHGYKMPHLVFWNVNAKNPTFHASKDDKGASLVSGYSQNVFKNVMDNLGTTPYDLMMEVVNSERYKDVVA